MKTEREKAIEQIEGLFPTDSQYDVTNQIGMRLLAQAKQEVEGWRNESTEVLVRYASLCVAEENRLVRENDRHYFTSRTGHY